MQKWIKRTLSLLLVVVLLIAVFAAAPFAVSAAEDEIEVNTIKEITVDSGTIKFLKFVPAKDMIICFYATSDQDTYGYICSESQKSDYDSNPSHILPEESYLASDDDGGDDSNFYIQYSVTAGTTYYLGARFFSASDSGSFQVTLQEIPLWEHSEGTLEKYNGTDTVIEIPSELDGDTITAIGDSLFQNNNHIQSVTIPVTVTSIGSNAFNNCSSLSSITLPENLESIGSSAFYYTPLSSIVIPASVTSIDTAAFNCCSKLASVTVLNKTNEMTFGGSVFNASYVKLFQCYQNSAADTYAQSAGLNIGYIDPNAQVSFDANGGEGAPAAVSVNNGSVTIPSTIPTYGIRSFLGWSANANAEQPDFLAGETYPIISNVTLYAVWHNVILFYSDDVLIGSYGGDEYSNAGEVCKNVQLPDKQGYAFKGFYHGYDKYYYHSSHYMWDYSCTPYEGGFENGVFRLDAVWVDSAPTILGDTVSLDGVIKLNVYVDFSRCSDVWSNPEITVKDYDMDYATEGDFDSYNRNRGYSVSDVAGRDNIKKISIDVYAKEMTDTIHLSIESWGNGEYADVEKNLTVQDYLDTLAAGAENYAPAGKVNELRNLCYATLNYGAAAQNQFGHRTDDLANANVPSNYRATSVPANLPYDTGSRADYSDFGMTYYASSLGLLSDTSYAVCFEMDGSTSVNAYYHNKYVDNEKVGEAVYTDTETGDSYSHSMRAYYISGIAAKDILNDFDITFSAYVNGHYDDDGQWVDGYNAGEKTATFSPKTYIAKVLANAGVDPDYENGYLIYGYYNTKEQQTLPNLVVTVMAIYDYSTRAAEYWA